MMAPDGISCAEAPESNAMATVTVRVELDEA
jgi:hypothetical protein